MIAIDPAKSFGHMQLVAVSVPQPIQPGFLVKTHGVHDERGVSIPMAY